MIFWFIAIGVICGIITGMGIGGGTLLIPALTMFFGVSQHSAQSINLMYYIPTGAVALVIHIKNKNIERKGLLPLILFGIIFAVLGSLFATKIEDDMLRKIFGGFLLLMGINELRGKV
jgi:uncharacterized membrane protein YfcA